MRPFLLLLPLLLVGCSSLHPRESGEQATGCREVVEAVYLSVTDARGEPAPGAAVTATNLRTGETYGPCPEGREAFGILAAGCQADPDIGLFTPRDLAYYKILGDEHRAGLSARGDTILVRGSRGDAAFETRLVIEDDGCHVQKTWGLDAVKLR